MSATFASTYNYLSAAPPTVGTNQACTLMAWMYTTVIGADSPLNGPGSTGVYVMLLSGAGTPNFSSVHVCSYNGDFRLYFENQIDNFAFYNSIDGGLCPIDTWTHLAVAFESDAIYAHVNGVQVGTGSGGGGTMPAWDEIRVGGFAGQLQDARFFSSRLTTAQIQACYRSRNAEPGVAPFASYPVFPGTTERALDWSGNGRTGTPGGTGAITDGTLLAPASWLGQSARLALSNGEVTPNPSPSSVLGHSALNRRFITTRGRRAA